MRLRKQRDRGADAAGDDSHRFTSPEIGCTERWQVSWLAGHRLTPIFPVSQWS